MTTPLQSLVGKTLGGYQVLAELGRGGMSVVFRAKDKPPLNREVALKVLKPELLTDPETVERFLAGARAEADLQHSNIVTIFGVGHDKGLHFIIMELVQGQPLSDVLQEGRPLPIARRQHILEQVADAIDFAHDQRMVHRDVKPSNVMLGAGDRVTLLDFGLVKAMDSGGHTQVGTIMGTPEYMSPEQARGESVGPATDIYSLGIMAYRMMTGTVPFSAEHSAAVLHKQAYEPPPAPRTLQRDIPAAAERVLLRALDKDPKRRWSTAMAFVDALAAADTRKGEVVRPSKSGQTLVAAPAGGRLHETSGRRRVLPSKPGAKVGAPPNGQKGTWTVPVLAIGAGLIVVLIVVAMAQGTKPPIRPPDVPTVTAPEPATDAPIVAVDTVVPTATDEPTKMPKATDEPTETPRAPDTVTPKPPPIPTRTPPPPPPTLSPVAPTSIEFYPDNYKFELDKDQLCTAVNWRTSGVSDVRLQIGGSPPEKISDSGRRENICFPENKMELRLFFRFPAGNEDSRVIAITRKN